MSNSKGGATNIALVHWHDDSSRWVTEAVNADAVMFTIEDPSAWIRIQLNKDGKGVTILGSGPLITQPQTSNQVRIGILRP